MSGDHDEGDPIELPGSDWAGSPNELNSFFKLEGFEFHAKFPFLDHESLSDWLVKWAKWLKEIGAETSTRYGGGGGAKQATPVGEKEYFCPVHPDRAMKKRTPDNRPARWRSAWEGYFCTFNWLDERGEKRWCREERDIDGKPVRKEDNG